MDQLREKPTPAPKKEPSPTEPTVEERAPEIFRFGGAPESKAEFMSMVEKAAAESQSAGGEVTFEFGGAKYRIQDTPDALRAFLKEVKKAGFKGKKSGKEPSVSTRAGKLSQLFLRHLLQPFVLLVEFVGMVFSNRHSSSLSFTLGWHNPSY